MSSHLRANAAQCRREPLGAGGTAERTRLSPASSAGSTWPARSANGSWRSFSGIPSSSASRHITQDEPDDNFIVRDDVLRGLKVLEKHADAVRPAVQSGTCAHAATLAAQLPNLPLVIDHLAKRRSSRPAGPTAGGTSARRHADTFTASCRGW
ncbi:MAG: hypothetical protein U0736_27190 [Gemmataceae bacterium]